MKQIFSIAIIVFLFSSCAPKLIPLKGNYPQTPIIYYTGTNKDKVWDNIIDFFAQRGISIRIIDRSSGLIISTPTNLAWTQEDKNGNMKNKDAYISIPLLYDKGAKKYYKPTSLTGEWNIRIKEVDGKTSINVNLFNIEASYYSNNYTYRTSNYLVAITDGKSTGVFEKLIFEIVK